MITVEEVDQGLDQEIEDIVEVKVVKEKWDTLQIEEKKKGIIKGEDQIH